MKRIVIILLLVVSIVMFFACNGRDREEDKYAYFLVVGDDLTCEPGSETILESFKYELLTAFNNVGINATDDTMINAITPVCNKYNQGVISGTVIIRKVDTQSQTSVDIFTFRLIKKSEPQPKN